MLFQFSFQSIRGASLVWALAWGIAPGRSWPRRRMPSATKTREQLNRMLPAPIRSSDLGLFHKADEISQQRPCLAIATGSYWTSSKDGHGSRVGSVAGSYIQPQTPSRTTPLSTPARHQASGCQLGQPAALVATKSRQAEPTISAIWVQVLEVSAETLPSTERCLGK